MTSAELRVVGKAGSKEVKTPASTRPNGLEVVLCPRTEKDTRNLCSNSCDQKRLVSGLRRPEREGSPGSEFFSFSPSSFL